MTKKPVLKSKKFVVYFYGDKDGGSICHTDKYGKMGPKNKSNLFNCKKEAKLLLNELVEANL